MPSRARPCCRPAVTNSSKWRERSEPREPGILAGDVAHQLWRGASPAVIATFAFLTDSTRRQSAAPSSPTALPLRIYERSVDPDLRGVATPTCWHCSPSHLVPRRRTRRVAESSHRRQSADARQGPMDSARAAMWVLTPMAMLVLRAAASKHGRTSCRRPSRSRYPPRTAGTAGRGGDERVAGPRRLDLLARCSASGSPGWSRAPAAVCSRSPGSWRSSSSSHRHWRWRWPAGGAARLVSVAPVPECCSRTWFRPRAISHCLRPASLAASTRVSRDDAYTSARVALAGLVTRPAAAAQPTPGREHRPGALVSWGAAGDHAVDWRGSRADASGGGDRRLSARATIRAGAMAALMLSDAADARSRTSPEACDARERCCDQREVSPARTFTCRSAHDPALSASRSVGRA